MDSEWGRKRAEAGHPEPFNLKYLGLGNEDATCTVLSGERMAENRFGQTPAVLPKTSEIKVADTSEYEAAPYSLTVIRIKSSTP